MIRRIAHAFARACWAIGDGINSLGDRINVIGVKRAPPSDLHEIIDRRPSWWRK